MSTYKGKFSSDDLSGTLGDKQSWHGVGCRIRTTLAPDRPRPRRNFDAGSVTQEWDVDLPRTPGPETDPPLPPIKDRGGMGFSGTIDFWNLGASAEAAQAMNGVQFKIAQTDPVTFQLSESEGADDWRVIGNFSSSSAAVDAMNTLIARAKFIAPEPTFYDENGVLTIQPVLP